MPIAISPTEFRTIATIARQRWGLNLAEHKLKLVEGRMNGFIARSRFDSVAEFIGHLQGNPTDDELLEFFDLLSTNTTSFFREMGHFDYMRDEMYPLWTSPGRPRSLRIWSAACSNGAEPYSLVIHLLEHLPDAEKWDIKVLATDLSNGALAYAKEACYTLKDLDGMPPALLKRHFKRVDTNGDRTMCVAEHVRERVAVHRLNLLEPWPMRGPFDVIFIRNVMIYFDLETRTHIISRMTPLLAPEGRLFIGGAETLFGMEVGLHTMVPGVYAKKAA